MAEFLEQSLTRFRSCFHREAAFRWFVIIIIAFILREDHLGVTSTIRALLLDHNCYDALIHFFRSEAYVTQQIREIWYRLVLDKAPILKFDGKPILIGDGVKQSKEGSFMPGVKKLHQESEDSSKGEYIFGHLFGAIGVVIGCAENHLCLPLYMSIQDGLRNAADWEGSNISRESHVLQMIENGYEAAKTLGNSYFVLDRYFLTVPALKRLAELNSSKDGSLLTLITKAKSNCRAYEEPEEKKPGKRGRPRKKGAAVMLKELFKTSGAEFTTASVMLYGSKTDVRYLCKDLLWGAKQYQKLRFVLVISGSMQCILVSTDTTLDPEKIIELYAFRFSIESCFKAFKQQFGGFCYHFWTSASRKLNHFKKKNDPDRLENVTDHKQQSKILKTVDATERFVQLGCIAMGLVQMMTFSARETDGIQKVRYLRTYRKSSVSEESLKYFLRRKLLCSFLACPDFMITHYIRDLQEESSGRKTA